MLDLSGCTAIRDLSGISNIRISHLKLSTEELPEGVFPHIACLSLDRVRSLNGIGPFSCIRHLDLQDAGISDLKDISEAKGLFRLEIWNCPNAVSLEGLQHLEGLYILHLERLRSLKDASAVNDLTLVRFKFEGAKFEEKDFSVHIRQAIPKKEKS
jgi:hypothetical protein